MKLRKTHYNLLRVGAAAVTTQALLVLHSTATAVAAEDTQPTQGTTAQPVQPAQEDALEEILVTAQRRRENLQDVPITVTAVTADSLAAVGMAFLISSGGTRNSVSLT